MNKITFTVDDDIVLSVGQMIRPNGFDVPYRVVRGWINAQGKPEYEAERVGLNRHEMRAKFAREKE